MKPVVFAGLALLVLGIGALVYESITYTTSEEIIDIGPVKANIDTEKTIPLSPILGGVAIACGTGLIILGRRKH
jgi:hypothetical protein